MTTIAKGSCTAIGSLPHHNVDAALAYSFHLSIPFLPQIPIRNPWEFMIAQALEGLPGLQVEPDGSVVLNVDVWHSRTHGLKNRLSEAFAVGNFECFEPTAAASSCWQPFVWELEEKKHTLAKIQIAGPMTSQWALKLKDGAGAVQMDKFPDLSTQIYRLALARAMAMSKRLQSSGIQPLLYLDEPGLFGLSSSNPKHLLGLQELRLVIQALRKEEVWVGLHCCSNTDWSAVLNLGLQFLSIDTALSLESLFEAKPALENFIRSGGRLSLGVIPTSNSWLSLHSINSNELFTRLIDAFKKHIGSEPGLIRKIVSEAIYTPACGLALHSVADAESVLGSLQAFSENVSRFLSQS